MGHFFPRRDTGSMLKQEWGYEYLGHLRSPQQPIEVRPAGRLSVVACLPFAAQGLVLLYVASAGI